MSVPKPSFTPAEPLTAALAPPEPQETRAGLADELARRATATATAVLPPLLTLAALLGIWQLAASSHPGGVPSPSAIWQDSHDLILDPFFDHGGTDKGLFWHVLTSLKRVGIGFSLSAICGVSLGVLIGANRWAHRGLDPVFQVLRTVPPLAWLPISLAMFQQAQPSALFVIFVTSIWPIIINTAVGVRNVPVDYVNVARVLRLSPIEYFFKILLPATTPYIFTGLRIGVGMSWLAIVASEMLLGGVGVGFFIWDQYNASRISDIVVALAWVGLTGFALDRLVALAGRLISRGDAAS
ncbi:nitrate ABC transporter permease [Phenylobacterium aquaticum]|uniref:nitrate ABC transporter permease n=1 Tax=Phenylobacterium aquaticum TaxID=1763816 RepID=UPI001F5CE4FB|nr:nitrate ABC transporter permease [Phenylobacterium aquaticum]MCI3131487.1 nitrate ABC transporter permease [Phenylobacterium aquaticum]